MTDQVGPASRYVSVAGKVGRPPCRLIWSATCFLVASNVTSLNKPPCGAPAHARYSRQAEMGLAVLRLTLSCYDHSDLQWRAVPIAVRGTSRAPVHGRRASLPSRDLPEDASWQLQKKVRTAERAMATRQCVTDGLLQWATLIPRLLLGLCADPGPGPQLFSLEGPVSSSSPGLSSSRSIGPIPCSADSLRSREAA